jgi:predicted HD phosphohydrolase
LLSHWKTVRAGDELIEAALLTASGTITHQVGYNTSIAAESDGAVCGVTGPSNRPCGQSARRTLPGRVWFGEAANDAVPHDFGDLAAQVGSVIMREIATDSHAEVLTAADGSWA